MQKDRWATLFMMMALLAAVPSTAGAQQGLIIHKALSVDMAISMAQGSLEKCRSSGYKCAITVLDATTMIALQDDGANLHRFDVSHKKAYTGLVYRRPSKDVVQGSKKTAEPVPLLEGTMPNPPIEGTFDMGGGLPILAGSEVAGAVAVSGGPNWDMDEACANAGLAKVADKLK